MAETLLIVDDDPVLLQMLVTVFQDDGRYSVYTATNGREALERARELTPALILLDISLPDMDGIEICRRIKSDRRTAQAQVVMVSGMDPERFALKAQEADACGFLQKPVSPATVMERVEKLFAEPSH